MIFLDNQASTPEAPEVIEAIAKASRDIYANPHSEHAGGRMAMRAVNEARESIALLIGCELDEIVFTSGATEANNIALQGSALAGCQGGTRFVTSTIEHKCIQATCRALENRGVRVSYCPVGPDGLFDLEALRDLVTPETNLVSLMLVNNEIGTIQDLAAIADLLPWGNTTFHSDISQATGRIEVDVQAIGLHMASLSAHKMHGPKGIGALFISKDTPTRPMPVYFGGGQELGLRPGTLPVPLCVGFGVAAELARLFLQDGIAKVTKLQSLFLAQVVSLFPGVQVVGSLERRVPHNLNLRFPGVPGERLIGSLQPHIAVSAGSACAAGEIQPSHVLRAVGLGAGEAMECIRVSFSRYGVEADVLSAADMLAMNALRICDK